MDEEKKGGKRRTTSREKKKVSYKEEDKDDDEFIVKIVSVAHDCCVRERGVSKSSLSQLCVKSARE